MKIIDNFIKWTTPLNVPLFHYTDAAGLLGISEKKLIWATHVRHLNDTAEYFGALAKIEAALTEKLRNVTYSDTAWTPHDALRLMREQEVFVSCFSEEGNLLSQWRAYCPRDGYVLGFNPDDLAALQTGATFAQCVYDPREQQELVETIAESLIEAFSDVDVRDFEWLSKTSSPIILLAVHHATLIKDHHFHEEKEWRVVVSNPLGREIKYRPGRLGVTPYLELPLQSFVHPDAGSRGLRLVCSSLTVGPRPDPDASVRAASNFANAKLVRLYDVDAPTVGYCNIPFRQ